MVADARKGLSNEIEAYFTFTPRPDNKERFDEQTAFYNSKGTGAIFLLGGNGAGCLAAEQIVYDPVKQKYTPVSQIDSAFHVIARNADGHRVIAKAERPRIYGIEDLYEVTLSNGQVIRVTLGHRLLTFQGWREIGDIVRDDDRLLRQIESRFLEAHAVSGAVKQCVDHTASELQSDMLTNHRHAVPPTVLSANTCRRQTYPCGSHEHDADLAFAHLLTCPKAFQKCESHSSRTPSGYLGCCCLDLHLCDALPRPASGIDPASLPRRVDAAAHSHSTQQKDALVCKQEYSHAYPCERHPSMTRCDLREHHAHARCGAFSAPCLLPFESDSNSLPFRESSIPAIQQSTEHPQLLPDSYQSHTAESSHQSATAFEVSPSCLLLTGETELKPAYITTIRFLRRDSYWDFHVPEHENYLMAGVWNHNTTTAALAKACRFMLETPAPRRNTPFWIIAESYEQVCSMWDEKLSQQGHLPSHVIDWDRIHWFKRNNNWPFRVPLKSHQGAGGKNWLLEFKSWNQGRGQMQARSIGGFLFIEQFPWPVFQETLRGCREYNFPGAKLVEYTPVDPDLSLEIEEMLNNGHDPGPGLRQKGAVYLPHNWEVYHANTACAMEAGHVDKEWFKEYFGMIPEDMLDVRMKGLFASFEGTIYKEFDTNIHCVGDEVWPRLTNAHWVRGIDWGGGPENAFACLWAAFDTDGTAYIMDEYYSLDQSCTTIDHLINIQEQSESVGWTSNDKRFGMTYADPADPDNFRIASKLSMYAKQHKGISIQNMPMARAKNAVYEGIEHVRMLMKCSREVSYIDTETNTIKTKMCPRIYIHRANCPNLVRELKVYRWLRSGEQGRGVLNPRNARRAPTKYNDHACDALRYLLFTHHGMLGATIDSAKRLNRDVHHDEQFGTPASHSNLSKVINAHRV